jgi:YqjK-like protein
MRESLLILAERRAHLTARARSERESLSAMLVPADAAANLAGSLIRVARDVLDLAGRHPLSVTAVAALLIALRPRRAFTWVGKGWSLWRLYRGARGWWLRFATPATRNAGAPVGAPK